MRLGTDPAGIMLPGNPNVGHLCSPTPPSNLHHPENSSPLAIYNATRRLFHILVRPATGRNNKEPWKKNGRRSWKYNLKIRTKIRFDHSFFTVDTFNELYRQNSFHDTAGAYHTLWEIISILIPSQMRYTSCVRVVFITIKVKCFTDVQRVQSDEFISLLQKFAIVDIE